MKLWSKDTTKQPKQIVIELYSTFETDENALSHELIANGEAGAGLRKANNQKQHFVYALNELTSHKLNPKTINLADEQGLAVFSSFIRPGDSIIIIAQGNKDEQKIAGYNAEDFIELLHVDLELADLQSIELFAANMGFCSEFREIVSSKLRGAEELVTYKAVPTANLNFVGAYIEDITDENEQVGLDSDDEEGTGYESDNDSDDLTPQLRFVSIQHPNEFNELKAIDKITAPGSTLTC